MLDHIDAAILATLRGSSVMDVPERTPAEVAERLTDLLGTYISPGRAEYSLRKLQGEGRAWVDPAGVRWRRRLYR